MADRFRRCACKENVSICLRAGTISITTPIPKLFLYLKTTEKGDRRILLEIDKISNGDVTEDKILSLSLKE